DDWHFGQGGFRMDWDRSEGSRVSLQGDVYRGRISQPSAGDVAVSGGNLNASWSHTISANSDVRARLYYDRTHPDIPGRFGEDNDYTGVEIQPSGRVNWTVNEFGTLWAAVSRALRTPSRIDRELFAPGQPPYFLAGGPSFHSEEELAYEAGYRHQRGSLALSVATFYNRYYGLRSVERANPPAAFPLVIANGQDGESYGAELSTDYRVTNRWRLVAGYTELRIHVWALPTSTDTSRGSAENHTPDRQFSLRSSTDLPGHVSLDGTFRYVGEIVNQQV